MKLAAFSVDLDEIGEYFAIHGLGPASSSIAHLAYDVALPRLMAFAQRRSLPLTLFVVGRDVKRPAAAQVLKEFVARGDELGNHTLDHAYDVSRLAVPARREQIAEGARIIREATGYEPRGFRAPGYTLSEALISDLEELGVEYDSSVFACPTYYSAKAVVLGLQRLVGRRSASILDDPRVLLSPNQPYRLGRPYFRRGNGLREIPITLTPGLRLPYFGTSLGMLARGPFADEQVRWFTRGVASLPSVNLEFHALDFLDAADGLKALQRVQPGLGIPWKMKERAYASAVSALTDSGFAWVTLRELASRALP